MENELKSIEGVKEMSALASEGHASVTLEFNPGFDAKEALAEKLKPHCKKVTAGQ